MRGLRGELCGQLRTPRGRRRKLTGVITVRTRRGGGADTAQTRRRLGQTRRLFFRTRCETQRRVWARKRRGRCAGIVRTRPPVFGIPISVPSLVPVPWCREPDAGCPVSGPGYQAPGTRYCTGCRAPGCARVCPGIPVLRAQRARHPVLDPVRTLCRHGAEIGAGTARAQCGRCDHILLTLQRSRDGRRGRSCT